MGICVCIPEYKSDFACFPSHPATLISNGSNCSISLVALECSYYMLEEHRACHLEISFPVTPADGCGKVVKPMRVSRLDVCSFLGHVPQEERWLPPGFSFLLWHRLEMMSSLTKKPHVGNSNAFPALALLHVLFQPLCLRISGIASQGPSCNWYKPQTPSPSSSVCCVHFTLGISFYIRVLSYKQRNDTR